MTMQHFYAVVLVGLVVGGMSGMEEVPPKEKEEASIEHEQARVFHMRLIEEHPAWFQGDVQAYYKKIEPIRSRPLPGRNEWRPHSIFIDGRRIMPNAQNIYIHDGISFDPNSWQNFDPNKGFTISILYDNKAVNVQFKQNSQKKTPVLTRIEDYNTCVTRAQGDQFFLRHKITFKGMVPGQEGDHHIILIEAANGQREAIILQGMEFVFNKDAGTTQMLLDFVDGGHEPVALMKPIVCEHSNGIVDNTVFCIKNHKIYENIAIYSFFDSPATRRKWVPDELDFYDLNNNRLIPLPSCYASADDPQKRAADPIVWVLGEGNDSLYHQPELELQNTNDYICCDNDSFYALLPYKASCRDYLSSDPNKRVMLDYLIQVKKPSLRIGDVGMEMGHDNWASGLYKSVKINNRTCWQHINEAEDVLIEFGDKVLLNTTWPAEPLDAQEIIKWGDAGQRFFGSFQANIQHCNQALSNTLSTWDKLNHIDLSNVKLADDVTWNSLFTAIGTMRQITQLGFAYNHPVTNILEGWYGRLGDQAHDDYVNLAICLSNLTNLKRLSIHGLWLKHHSQLGSGCLNGNSVSREVSTLIGINYKSSNGMRYLISTICALAQLESLSIDSIPNHGSSEWGRAPIDLKAIALPVFLILSPLAYANVKAEDAALKQLVNDSADNLARMPSLRTISVHSPGGNCVNYFSQAFRERLAITRAAHPNFPTLTINAEVLK